MTQDFIPIAGQNIALHKTIDQTPQGGDRLAQPAYLYSDKLSLSIIRENISTPDPLDISDIATTLAPGIEVKDQWNLVVQPFHSLNIGTCRITPFVAVGSDYIELKTKESGVNTPFVDGALYPSPCLAWDFYGGNTIFLHVTWLGEGTGNIITLKGGLL